MSIAINLLGDGGAAIWEQHTNRHATLRFERTFDIRNVVLIWQGKPQRPLREFVVDVFKTKGQFRK